MGLFLLKNAGYEYNLYRYLFSAIAVMACLVKTGDSFRGSYMPRLYQRIKDTTSNVNIDVFQFLIHLFNSFYLKNNIDNYKLELSLKRMDTIDRSDMCSKYFHYHVRTY